MSKYQATNNDMPKEAAIYGDVYMFYQRFYKGENTDEYWEAVIEASGELERKHGRDPLLVSLLLAVLTDLEHPERRLKRYEK